MWLIRKFAVPLDATSDHSLCVSVGSYTHRSWVMLEKKLWVLLLLVPTVIAAGAGVMCKPLAFVLQRDLTKLQGWQYISSKPEILRSCVPTWEKLSPYHSSCQQCQSRFELPSFVLTIV